MQSMRERAELSGATYAVTSAVGQGTKVCAGWPAEPALIAQFTEFGASEIASGLCPIQYEHENVGKTWNKVATAEVDEDALKPGRKEAYRALPDTLTLEEMETA